MIGKLTGRFEGTSEGGLLLIDVGGVGYSVRVSSGTLATLNPSTSLRANSEVSLFIHTAVRDDAIDLYGFPTQEELSFFKQLMSVSGIGPKTALGILNVSEVHTLKRGIAAGDAASLTKVFGIGKKSAERIVVELRDKMVIVSTAPGAAGKGSEDFEVIEALIALGYSAQEARAAIKEISPAAGSPSMRVAAALKRLGSRTAIS